MLPEETHAGDWVVIFTSPTCGPCRMVKPHLAAYAEAHSGLGVHDVEITEHPDVAEAFGVRATPTLAVIRDGDEVARRSGALMKAQLSTWLDSTLDG